MITIDTALKLLAKDKSVVSYRPEFKALTGSVTASILLQQIFYRWSHNSQEPFYKFKSPCLHKDYKAGDSWTEELGFSENEFDTAISKIGIKVKKYGDRPEGALVWYWTDNERKTYFDINKEVFGQAVAAIYEGKFEVIGKVEIARDEKGRFIPVNPECGFTKTRNADLPNRHVADLPKPEERVFPIYTEITTENTQIVKPKSNDLSDSLFDAFWNTYNYKKDKKKAQTSFNRLNKKDQQAALDGIAAYDAYRSRPENEYLAKMHPTTYLNGRRWEDEYPEPEQKEQVLNDVELTPEVQAKFNMFHEYFKKNFPSTSQQVGCLTHSQYLDIVVERTYLPRWNNFFGESTYRDNLKQALQALENDKFRKSYQSLYNYLTVEMKIRAGLDYKHKAA